MGSPLLTYRTQPTCEYRYSMLFPHYNKRHPPPLRQPTSPLKSHIPGLPYPLPGGEGIHPGEPRQCGLVHRPLAPSTHHNVCVAVLDEPIRVSDRVRALVFMLQAAERNNGPNENATKKIDMKR